MKKKATYCQRGRELEAEPRWSMLRRFYLDKTTKNVSARHGMVWQKEVQNEQSEEHS